MEVQLQIGLVWQFQMKVEAWCFIHFFIINEIHEAQIAISLIVRLIIVDWNNYSKAKLAILF